MEVAPVGWFDGVQVVTPVPVIPGISYLITATIVNPMTDSSDDVDMVVGSPADVDAYGVSNRIQNGSSGTASVGPFVATDDEVVFVIRSRSSGTGFRIGAIAITAQ